MASTREIQAGKASVVMGMDISPLQKGLDAAQQKLAAFGKGVAAFGAGIAAAGATISAPFLYGLSVFADMGSQISAASRISGMSLDDVQTAAFALKVSFEELTTMSKKMDQFLDHVSRGSGEATRQLNELGLSFSDLARLSEGDRILKLGEAINRTYSDISQRHAAMIRIFGRQALQADFSGDLAARVQRLRDLGGVVSPADVALAKDYTKAQKEMGIAMQGLWARIGATAAPAMTQLARLLTDIIVRVQKLVDANRPLLELIFKIADKAVLVGAAIGILGAAIYGGSYAFSFMSGAISIVGGLLSTLWGLATFAASGFGILKVMTFAWSVASVAASMIAKAAIWAYNAAVTVAHALTWGFKAALIVLGVTATLVGAAIYLAFGGAIIAGVVALGYYVGKWLMTLNVVKEGIAIISAAWSGLWAGIKAVAAPVLENIALAFRFFMDPIIGWFTGTLMPAVSHIGTMITSAVSRIGSSLSTMFSGLVSTATAAWGGIQDAFAIGDWEMIWDIVKIAAELAWQHIKHGGMEIFSTIRDTAIDIWHEITDTATDTFYAFWVKMKKLFVENWAFLKEGFWNVAAELADSLGLTTRASQARDRAYAARMGSYTDIARIDADERRREIDAGNARGLRDIDEVELRRNRDAAATAGNDAEVERLQGLLDDLNQSSARRRRMAPPPAPPPGLLASSTIKMGSIGSFSTMEGVFGDQSRAETAAERTARLAVQQVALEGRIAGACEGILQRVARGMMVRP
jgi:hypothetical protein